MVLLSSDRPSSWPKGGRSPQDVKVAGGLTARPSQAGARSRSLPQCGSTDFAPIQRPPRPESADGDAGPTLNLMLCGGCMDHDRWECRSCGHRWHEEWPEPSEAEREQMEARWRVEQSLKVYARVTALAQQPPKEPAAFVDRVLRLTSCPDNRSFGVRFSWGRVVVEKTTGLVDEGGAPEFRCGGPGSHGAPAGWDTEAEAIAVVLRHVAQYGDAPYTAIRSVSAP